MSDYTGNMEGGIWFSAEQPFVLLGYPTENPDDAKAFDTEQEARQFIAEVRKADPYVTYARLYGFADGKWERLYESTNLTGKQFLPASKLDRKRPLKYYGDQQGQHSSSETLF